MDKNMETAVVFGSDRDHSKDPILHSLLSGGK